MISIEFVFQDGPCYEREPKFTLSLADPMGRLRSKLVRVVECLVFWSCFMEYRRETPKLTITQYKDDIRTSSEVQHCSQTAVLTLYDRIKCFQRSVVIEKYVRITAIFWVVNYWCIRNRSFVSELS